MKLTTMEVKGRTLAVNVDAMGDFSAIVGEGVTVHAKTLEELREKIGKAMATAAVRVNIPVMRNNDGRVQRGAFTGIHGSNGNYLIKWEGEKGTDQISYFSFSSGYSRFIDPACEAEYAELVRRSAEADRALESFEKQHFLDIKDLMAKALNAASKSAAA